VAVNRGVKEGEGERVKGESRAEGKTYRLNVYALEEGYLGLDDFLQFLFDILSGRNTRRNLKTKRNTEYLLEDQG
jgi:hypothetical protein